MTDVEPLVPEGLIRRERVLLDYIEVSFHRWSDDGLPLYQEAKRTSSHLNWWNIEVVISSEILYSLLS